MAKLDYERKRPKPRDDDPWPPWPVVWAIAAASLLLLALVLSWELLD